MVDKRRKVRGRSSKASFASKPHHLFRANFTNNKPSETAKLSDAAFRLLDNLAAQFNGSNNGDLCAVLKTMNLYGWSSSGKLADAIAELIANGFVQSTRQGGRNRCSLYALTWLPIDECNGKLDIKETIVPSNLWKPENENLRNRVFVERWSKRKKRSKN